MQSSSAPPARLSLAAELREARREATLLEWQKLQPAGGAWFVLAVALLLAWGIFIGHPRWGMVAAGGAVSAGFGTLHRITSYRIVPMVLVGLGMSASAWIGSVYGHRGDVDSVLITAVWGLGLGVATSVGSEHQWLGLQWVIAVCISAAYPAKPWPAAERVALLMLGALVQTVVMVLVWWARRERFTQEIDPRSPLRNGVRPLVARGLSLRSAYGRYTYRVVGVLAIARTAELIIGFPNSYWIPMTAAIVMQPHFATTLARGLTRMAGTVVGAAVATALAATCRPSPLLLAVLVVIFAGSAYALLRVNYALFACCLTAYVVFLLAFIGLPEPIVALHRTLATMIGSLIALIAQTAASILARGFTDPPELLNTAP